MCTVPYCSEFVILDVLPLSEAATGSTCSCEAFLKAGSIKLRYGGRQ